MTGFGRFLRNEKPEAVIHPKLRFWKSMKDRGVTLVCELVRERDGLSFGPARLYVHFLDAQRKDLQSPDEVEWDAGLNDALLEIGVRAASDENEINRFGLTLRDRFEDPEGRFGEGYFNAVLLEYIRQSPFGSESAVIEKLADITANQPSRCGSSYAECRDAIETVLVHCGNDLMNLYDKDERRCSQILTGALAKYLDERFSITNRKLLGWGKPRRG